MNYPFPDPLYLLFIIDLDSKHLVPSHLGLEYVLRVETNLFPELVVIFPDYAIRISLGAFSILLLEYLSL